MGPPTLERIAAVVDALGHPESAYRVIHVTGTNGKGSTAAMAAALLDAAGRRSGAYTSPHLEHPAERIAVGGARLAPEELWVALDAVAGAAGRAGVAPTWFEAMTAAGLWWFASAQVDTAVVEVGMLGRFDATNVVHADVAVVTNVELDHTDVAGPTRAHVASEKAGIIEVGRTLVLGETDPGLRPVFEAEGPEPLLLLGRDLGWSARRSLGLDGQVVDLFTPWAQHRGVRVGSLGAHQCDNAALAVAAVEALLGAPLPAGALAPLARPAAAGRLELLGRDPTLLVDGAHNPAGAAVLRRALADLDAAGALGAPRVLLFGMLAGRDPGELLGALDPGWFDAVVVTEPPSPRAAPAGEVCEAVIAAGGRAPAVGADPASALALAREAAGPRGVVVGTGSLYLVGALRGAARDLGGSAP